VPPWRCRRRCEVGGAGDWYVAAAVAVAVEAAAVEAAAVEAAAVDAVAAAVDAAAAAVDAVDAASVDAAAVDAAADGFDDEDSGWMWSRTVIGIAASQRPWPSSPTSVPGELGRALLLLLLRWAQPLVCWLGDVVVVGVVIVVDAIVVDAIVVGVMLVGANVVGVLAVGVLFAGIKAVAAVPDESELWFDSSSFSPPPSSLPFPPLPPPPHHHSRRAAYGPVPLGRQAE